MCFEHILISQPVSTSKQPYVGLVAVQSVSHVQLFATPWTAAHQASLSFTISYSLLRLMSIKSAMPSSHLISVVPFSSCLQSFPASGSFPRSLLFTSGSQSTGASGLASVLPMNIQGWFHLGLTGLITLQSKGLLRVFSSTTVQKHQFSAFFMVQLSHPYMTTGKAIALTWWTFVGKVMFCFFNMLSMFVIAFLSRDKCLNFMAAVTVHSDFGAQENKICQCFHFFPFYLSWSDRTGCHDLSVLNAEF